MLSKIKANYADVIRVLAATEYEGEDTFGGAVCRLAKDLLTRADEAETVIKALMDNLPDSRHEDDTWMWCWNELGASYDDAQEGVKAARKAGQEFLGG